ncbi:hypothetical protein KCP74_03905 [Salmonella enterica subsp. enterica]|nr:hypothetical protein KCP74_03905 [Salmonella enterica subsp. enterica]
MITFAGNNSSRIKQLKRDARCGCEEVLPAAARLVVSRRDMKKIQLLLNIPHHAIFQLTSFRFRHFCHLDV